jgi:hypothetical protein
LITGSVTDEGVPLITLTVPAAIGLRLWTRFNGDLELPERLLSERYTRSIDAGKVIEEDAFQVRSMERLCSQTRLSSMATKF